MIEFKVMKNPDEFFHSDVECLVNWVNCSGEYENSFCKHFFNRFLMYGSIYKERWCKENLLKIGAPEFSVIPSALNIDMEVRAQYIITLPYKRGWRTTVWPVHIINCLENLKKIIDIYGLYSLSIPLVGYKMRKDIWQSILKMYLDLDKKGTDIFIYSKIKII